MIYFTADHHFGHTSIIRYCNRPFRNDGHMDKELIGRWNDVVTKDDVVYHLGDFTLGGLEIAREYFARLNGKIYVLSNPWHHDKYWMKAYSGDFATASGWVVELLDSIIVLERRPPIVLCHYPMAEWDRKHHGAWHLHGHSHGKHRAPGKILDVGVDAMGFYPVALDTIEKLMEEL